MAEVYRDGRLLSASITPDEAGLDLNDLDEIEEFIPLFQPVLELTGIANEAISQFGWDSEALDQKDMDLRTVLGTMDEIGGILKKHGKTARIYHNGKDVLILGKGAKSLLMEIGGYKNIEVRRKIMALRLAYLLYKFVKGVKKK